MRAKRLTPMRCPQFFVYVYVYGKNMIACSVRYNFKICDALWQVVLTLTMQLRGTDVA